MNHYIIVMIIHYIIVMIKHHGSLNSLFQVALHLPSKGFVLDQVHTAYSEA